MIKNQKGFTLINMLVAVSMIAIVAAMAATTVTSRLPAYRLSAATRKVMSDLISARTESVGRNTPVNITFSAAGYTIDGKVVSLADEYKAVAIVASGSLTFFPTGMASNNVTVTLTGEPGLAAKHVEIARGGRVRIR